MLKPGNYYNHTRFKGGVALILHTGWFCHFYVDFIMRQLKEVKLNLCQASIIKKQRLFSIFSTQTDRFYLNNIPLCSLLFRRSTENVWKMLKWLSLTHYKSGRFCQTPLQMSRRVTRARVLRPTVRNPGVIYRSMFFLIFGG